MFRKNKFRIGSRVIATALTGQKIIGDYQGAHNSVGVWVRGVDRENRGIIKLWQCISLTLEAVKEPEKTELINTFQSGDPVNGVTRTGERASGFYQNVEGKYLWIRGWLDGVSKFEPKIAYKIFRNSAQPGLSRKDLT